MTAGGPEDRQTEMPFGGAPGAESPEGGPEAGGAGAEFEELDLRGRAPGEPEEPAPPGPEPERPEPEPAPEPPAEIEAPAEESGETPREDPDEPSGAAAAPLDDAPELPPALQLRLPLVRARGLTKSYGGEPVVRGIDFELERGECLGILGPNGAGKTTTINMICCFVRPTSGSLDVFARPVATAAREIKRRLGVVSQENNLDPDLTVMRNLLVYGRYFGLPRRERKERAAELLEFVQLEEKAGDHIRTLSGGMRRRLTLARALISSPELLVLDEPTTGLDPQARHVVWQKLRALNRAGVTMLLTTHYMEEAAQLCDRILIMDQGEIIARGAPEELISTHVGAEVIELFPPRVGAETPDPSGALAVLAAKADHVERAGDEVYGFFRDPEAARSALPALTGHDFVHRRATLEDVFLRLTGRDLRE